MKLQLLKYLDQHIEEYLLALALSLMCILIGLQIVFRYFGNMPLAWTEELARYLFVWLIYLGCSYAVRKRRHLKVDAVLLLFGSRGRFVLKLISNILFLVFCLVILVYGSKMAYLVQTVKAQTSPVMQIPMGLIYGSVPAGALLMTIRLIQDTILLIMEKRVQQQDINTTTLLQKQINEEMNLNG